jgi:2-polyprenyl-6-methoxyphenol hydroxylase-like FAD-dependent oxidoreductase
MNAHATYQPHYQAVVVGAGIGGLTTAIALKQAGLAVTVLERAPELRAVGAGLSLWPNAVHALERLGLGRALAAIAMPADDSALHTADGRRLGGSLTAEIRERYGAPLVVVHRGELQALLLDALGRDSVRTGWACEGIHVDGDTAIVSSRDAALRATLVVGADGIHSRVRAHFDDRRAQYAGYTAWRGVTDAGTVPSGEFLGRGSLFGIAPLTRGRAYWWASVRGTGGEVADRANLIRHFGHWASPIGELIEGTPAEHLVMTPLMTLPPARRLVDGPLALLGDAAHPMLPNLGQGGCQAIEDAVVLARCVAGSDVRAGLERYAELRAKRTRSVVAASAKMARVVHLRNPVAIRARNAAMRLTKPSASAKRLGPIIGPAPGLA